MQPNQNQTPIPAPQGQPAVAPTPTRPPEPIVTPTVVNTIQAPSQAELRPTAQSLTSTTAPQMPIAPESITQSPTPQPAYSSQPQAQPVATSQPQVTQPSTQAASQPLPPAPAAPQTTVAPQPAAATTQAQAQPQQPDKPKKLTKEQQAKQATAQNSLLISEIRENMVIMNDGSFRAVVACESINYDLMSNEEREGIEYSYQNFINTLYFPIQVVVQSRKIDLKPYMEKLEKIRSGQENMLLGVLMDEYLDFIFDISQQANIMRKDFFVVVPYYLTGDIDSATNSFKNLSDGLVSSVHKTAHIKINARDYEKAKSEMKNRVGTVVNGLMNMSVRAGQLPTKALSELYYNFYNPDTAIEEPIQDFRNYTGLYTKKGVGEAPRPDLEMI